MTIPRIKKILSYTNTGAFIFHSELKDVIWSTFKLDIPISEIVTAIMMIRNLLPLGRASLPMPLILRTLRKLKHCRRSGVFHCDYVFINTVRGRYAFPKTVFTRWARKEITPPQERKPITSHLFFEYFVSCSILGLCREGAHFSRVFLPSFSRPFLSAPGCDEVLGLSSGVPDFTALRLLF